MKNLLSILFVSLCCSTAIGGDEIKIYFQQDGNKDSHDSKFFCIIRYTHVRVEGNSDEISVGKYLLDGSLYLSGEKVNNVMLFVRPFDQTVNEQDDVMVLRFVGGRQDMYIYLPKKRQN